MNSGESTNPARRVLRERLSQPGIIPGVAAHDVFTALLLEQHGVPLVFLGGFGVSASLLGLPDLDFLSMSEMADAIRRTTARVKIPVIADADTGHGDIPHVYRTVQSFESAGAAGLLIEDQVMPKRCGHFAGKQVVSIEEGVERVRAAVAARTDPGFVIIARTDARAVNGLDDAIERANRYGAAGADLVFVEGPQTQEELAEIPRQVERPALANMLTGGVTPVVTTPELENMGYTLAAYPVETLMMTAWAIRQLCEALLTRGRVDNLAGSATSFDELRRILGLEEFLKE